MGFTLKKIISFFLEPFVIGFLLALIAFLFLLFNSYKKAKIFLALSLCTFFLISSSFFSNILINPLEQKYQKIENIDLEEINYILLLGGDFSARAYEVIKLYQKKDGIKIITSGYKGNELITQAQFAKNELIKLGVLEKDIIMQESPKDTEEEAIEIKKIVGENKFILVTTATHMPRAMLIFEKYNLNAIPSPTAFGVEDLKSDNYLTVNEILKTQRSIHEYIGITWLKLKALLQ